MQGAGELPTDVRVSGAELYFLPVETRVPLKFGAETLTSVTCARVRLAVCDRRGRSAEGWGETPLSVQWSWPSAASYLVRHEAMQEFCRQLVGAWVSEGRFGHPLEVGNEFVERRLPALLDRFNAQRPGQAPMPLLAGLVCSSAFDLAVHDAFGNLLGLPVYDAYGPEHLSTDLAGFLEPAAGAAANFRGQYPADFLVQPAAAAVPAWHLVGGLDPLVAGDAGDSGPRDGHPYYLRDWIERDGLKCLKIKLRGDDAGWDYDRIVRVGAVSRNLGVEYLTTDFNCTVNDPAYVHQILDELEARERALYQSILYVEQPFPYDLQAHPIDVRELAARKPLLMDESADSWRHVRLGRSLGWNGVALKTCKTQTGALLSLCWAKTHGMHIMVQDLTNPMLAQIPHVLLAAHAGTMLGVESNAMQFYPDASAAEAEVHPGLYRRREGRLDLSSVRGAGFGYRVEEIARRLPPAAARQFR